HARLGMNFVFYPCGALAAFCHTSTTILESPLSSVFVGFSHTALYFDSRCREFRIPRILEFPNYVILGLDPRISAQWNSRIP
ncbi:MAG: hypothetical protein SOZ73_03730, partial [Campylobacter sp.]|nr:hypothetical protein [Campylobacter sp.]